MTEAFDLHAAGLRSDGTDRTAQVDALAVRLEGALPTRTTVRRRAGRWLSRRRRVDVEVRLGGNEYMLAYDGDDELRCTRARAVRGVQIKHEALTLGEWLAALERDLREEAEESAEARAALERLLA